MSRRDYLIFTLDNDDACDTLFAAIANDGNAWGKVIETPGTDWMVQPCPICNRHSDRRHVSTGPRVAGGEALYWVREQCDDCFAQWFELWDIPLAKGSE